jgi:geranylgeranyl reductase family protein
MKEYDVAVVGGGPIGGRIAQNIAEKNFKVAVFEQNKQIGEPLKCAGLVTPRVFDFVDFSEELVIQNKIKGANIHSPSGHTLTIGGDKEHAFVIDRIKFDKEIIKNSERKGVEVFLDNKIISAQKQEKHVELITSQKTAVKCNLLIGADGPYSKVRDMFSLPRPGEFLKGIGAEISGTNLDSDFVEIFIGNKVAPGFFAWIIPTNKQGSKARIGLCINQNVDYPPKYYFSDFLKNKHASHYFENIEITKHIGGVVPLGPLRKTCSSNVMIVGDAAAQVKPTSGGGIYTGLLCAQHCSAVAVDALKKNNFTSNFLKKYYKLWSADIGTELNIGMKLRKIFKNLSDKQLDKYVLKFQNPKIREVITKHGDIDHPIKLVKPLLKTSPSLLKLLPSIIKE